MASESRSKAPSSSWYGWQRSVMLKTCQTTCWKQKKRRHWSAVEMLKRSKKRISSQVTKFFSVTLQSVWNQTAAAVACHPLFLNGSEVTCVILTCQAGRLPPFSSTYPFGSVDVPLHFSTWQHCTVREWYITNAELFLRWLNSWTLWNLNYLHSEHVYSQLCPLLPRKKELVHLPHTAYNKLR